MAVALPVERPYFRATAVGGKKVYLDRETNAEVNNDFLTVEKSTDGQDFVARERVAATVNTTAGTRYAGVDPVRPRPGFSYHRLKRTEFAATCGYSPLRSVMFRRLSDGLSVRSQPATMRF